MLGLSNSDIINRNNLTIRRLIIKIYIIKRFIGILNQLESKCN